MSVLFITSRHSLPTAINQVRRGFRACRTHPAASRRVSRDVPQHTFDEHPLWASNCSFLGFTSRSVMDTQCCISFRCSASWVHNSVHCMMLPRSVWSPYTIVAQLLVISHAVLFISLTYLPKNCWRYEETPPSWRSSHYGEGGAYAMDGYLCYSIRHVFKKKDLGSILSSFFFLFLHI